MKPLLRLRPLILALPFLLGGCAGTMQRIADCKVGDWNLIGHKDGIAGEPANFAERKEFCDDHADNKQAAAGADSLYAAGWNKGNWELWSGWGEEDGVKGLLPTQYEQHAASSDVRKHGTPLNRPAYDNGWTMGNSSYWHGIGRSAGIDGQPLAAPLEAGRSRAAAMQMRFDEAAFSSGWQVGNRTFWQDAGYNDAHNGVPDSELQNRAARARSAGVQVQEEVYRTAWNAELVNYWRNLGTEDAVNGREFGMRSKEARARGLKVLETEYRLAWETRLTDYWRQAGADDGYGKPFLLDNRIANAARDQVFVLPSTRSVYTAAWQEQNARYCQPEVAFERGRANQGMAVDVCRAELRDQLKHAYVSGQDYESVSARHRQAVNDLEELNGRVNDGYHRLSRLEREMRNASEAKDRPVNEESKKQDARREQERRELLDHIRRNERRRDDARVWVEQYQRDMERLRRNIY
ncbi:DUF2799 domain-containing protein [Pseudoduganella danionis]|uniref:DUF2799 domain-containing protein n=1 Tax=Pseudoduganella danionis TaxID=1890295 RepID=UPI0035B0D49C